ncbi:MAG: hypothetical protein WBG54_01685 [Acidobacteriaceae bacterium]
METAEIVREIDAEIARLQEVRALLSGSASAGRVARRPGKRVLSPEARARIAAAQRKRWAKQKSEGGKKA